MDELDVGLARFPPLLGSEELLLVEHVVLLPDVVDGPSKLVGQHRQGLAFAMFPLEPCVVSLSPVVFSQEADRGLGEGPLQVHVADLPAGAARDLAGRLLGTRDQPGIGGQLLRPVEAVDVAQSSLRNWVKQADIDEGKGPEGALTTEERAELRRLRRENRRLQSERDFLKKATAFFAKEEDQRTR